MLQQLVNRIQTQDSVTRDAAALKVLLADPLDLTLHAEQVWAAFTASRPLALQRPPGVARKKAWEQGEFATYVPAPPPLPALAGAPAWDHLGYSFVLENTRAVQILRRVVREYRSGEGLGIPSIDTQRWLDITEALLFGAANPLAAWLCTSTVRSDPEAVRRNAYWRLFGLDLAFGTDDNRPFTFDKATAANTAFVALFEELLFELWQAISNLRNLVGVNASDNDRIYRLCEQLAFVLNSRRQEDSLAREELAAATALGWVELTLSADTPVVVDLRAQATSPADRLRLIGERVALPTHSKSAALFSMCAELSLFLRYVESGAVSGPNQAWLLYQPRSTNPSAIGDDTRRVITEWAAATGKDLKTRARAVEVNARPIVGMS